LWQNLLLKTTDKGKHSLQMNKLWYLLCFFVLFFLQTVMVYAQDNQGSALKKVVIDPGHGGVDPGASGARSKEKDIVLDIALRVGKMINAKFPDVEVIYTRKTDVFVELDKRSDIANKVHADLFISIHANSVKRGSKCPSGTETFVMGNSRTAANMEVAQRENEVILLEEDYSTRYAGFDPNKPESYIIFQLIQNSHLSQSIDFAEEIQNQFKDFAKRIDRRVNQANFLVLWKTAMPSVLIELGFICHQEEEKYMSSATGKEKLATAIFQAFSSYKAKIEDRSSFRQDDTGTVKQPEPLTTKPETTNSKPPAQNPNGKAANEVKTESSASKKVEFCVQIANNSKPMDTNPDNFNKRTDVERIQAGANLYKYILGRTANYASAQETLQKIRADFPDAFLVCIVDDQIIPLAEGLKLINN